MVSQPELERINPKLICDVVHRDFKSEVSLRRAKRPVRPRRRLIRIYKVAVIPHIRAVIQIECALPRPPYHAGPRCQVCARVHQRRRVYCGNRAVILHADFHGRLSRMTLPSRQKLLFPRSLYLHGLARPARQFGGDDRQPRLVLATVSCAQRSPDHAHHIALNAERRREAHPVRMHSPCSLPDRQPLALPHRHSRPWLQRRRRM